MKAITRERRSLLDKVLELSFRRGYLLPTAEIYGGFSGSYDWGPLGAILKRKLEIAWRQFFIRAEDNIYEIEGALILPEVVFKASGHLDGFHDPLTQCTKCNTQFRADHLIHDALNIDVSEGLSPDELTKLIEENHLTCPKCRENLGPVRVFNLMVPTTWGSVTGTNAYLRPETAQSIFLDFKRITRAMRAKLPFGIAQVGKSYRNEISPRQGLIRLREFTQMEIEFFAAEEQITHYPPLKEFEHIQARILTWQQQEEGIELPPKILIREALNTEILPNELLAYFIAKETIFFEKMGIPDSAMRFRHMLPHETPHYSKGNFDLEFKLSIGWVEVVGNAYRTDYDLRRHAEHSKEDLTIAYGDKKIIPHVIEPSFGVDRPVYAILEFAYRNKGVDRDWIWLQLPKHIVPVEIAIFPLMRKDGLPEKARKVCKILNAHQFDVTYDESGSIGRRYARVDEIGTPYSITCDYETQENDTVTVRDRETMHQVRVPIEDLHSILRKLLDGQITFDQVGTPVTPKE